MALLQEVGETRGIGLMYAIEIIKDKHLKIPFDAKISIGEKIAKKCIENGLICRPIGSSIVLCPQFIISKKQIDTIIEILHKTLKQVFASIS